MSDSPHDVCLVCGSHSLFNMARVFGGKLPKKRAALVVQEVVEIPSREVVVPFPKPHRLRRRATVASRQLAVAPFADERPVRFWLDGKLYLVEVLLDQWYDPEHIFYKLRADDGNLYILRQQTSTPNAEWDLISFREKAS